MLPNVRSALAQWITPVAAAQGAQSTQQGPPQKFERFTTEKPPPEKSATQPRGDPTSSGKKESAAEEHLPRPPPAPVIPIHIAKMAKDGAGQESTASIYFHLMMSLQSHHLATLRWFGMIAYRNANRNQKKTGRLRKGVIIDGRAS